MVPVMGFKVPGLVFLVPCMRFIVSSLVFMVPCMGFMVPGMIFMVRGAVFLVSWNVVDCSREVVLGILSMVSSKVSVLVFMVPVCH